MAYNHKDHFHQKAKKEGFAARSAYKMQEIQKKFKIIRANSCVLDLGCAPGAWAQVVCKILKSGHYYGIDLEEVNLELPNADFKQMDAYQWNDCEWVKIAYDVVLSDMAPKTTGVKIQDQARSQELVDLVIQITQQNIKKGGALVFKIFESGETKKLFQSLKKSFARVDRFRPDSTRKASEELYFVGIGYRG